MLLAERLRHAQEQQLASREPMARVLAIGADRGQPCGTLSVGVAEVTSVTDLGKAVERADRALYAAKQRRNLVVFIDALAGGRLHDLRRVPPAPAGALNLRAPPCPSSSPGAGSSAP